MKQKAVHPWREVVEPHENIKAGRVRQNDFAASLADVLADSGNPDYADPVRFFDRTFLTGGLRLLAGEVVGRLTGQGDGDAVMQIQTPFGGGKTHTLICLYHLVKNANACFTHPALKDYWAERGFQKMPEVPVAAIDGNQIGTSPVTMAPGQTVHTIWGHIAWQIGGADALAIIADADAQRVAPGGQQIDALLASTGGGLIILDEVVNYIEKAATVEVGESTLKAQTLTFLQTLTVRAGHHDRVVVAATLPKSHLELHGTSSKEALDRLQKVFGRVQKVREPVDGDEVHAIIRRRLFQDLGSKTKRDAVCKAYADDLKKRPQVPQEVRDANYRQRFERSYPFHPYLIDVLNRYVASNGKFQRTRGALRLLALITSELLARAHDGQLIQLSDINLENEEIRSELLELVDREFRSAVEADIVAADSNAAQLDEQGPMMKKWRLARGLTTAIFIFTCEAGNRSRGVGETELHLAAARPEVDFATIPGLIAQIRQKMHFVHFEAQRYRFSTTGNLNRILLDAEGKVGELTIRDRIKTEVKERLDSKPLAPYLWPKAPDDVPDSRTTKLVVLSLDASYGPDADDGVRKTVIKIGGRTGSGRRQHRNTLVFALPGAREVPHLQNLVRSLIAVETVQSSSLKERLSAGQRERLKSELGDRRSAVRMQILRTWRYVAWIGADGKTPDFVDMGPPSSEPEQKITPRVVEALRSKHKYLDTLAPSLITHPTKYKLWPVNESWRALSELSESFRAFTHLPILSGDGVLKTAVAAGVSSGLFGLASGTSDSDAELVAFNRPIGPHEVGLDDGWLLVNKELAEILKPDPPSEPPPPPPPPTDPPQPPEPPGGDEEEDEDTHPPPPPPPPPGGMRASIDVQVPVDRISEFVRGVIDPLEREADQITVTIRVEAEKASKFSSTCLELTVEETLHSIFGNVMALEIEE